MAEYGNPISKYQGKFKTTNRERTTCDHANSRMIAGIYDKEQIYRILTFTV